MSVTEIKKNLQYRLFKIGINALHSDCANSFFLKRWSLGRPTYKSETFELGVENVIVVLRWNVVIFMKKIRFYSFNKTIIASGLIKLYPRFQQLISLRTTSSATAFLFPFLSPEISFPRSLPEIHFRIHVSSSRQIQLKNLSRGMGLAASAFH